MLVDSISNLSISFSSNFIFFMLQIMNLIFLVRLLLSIYSDLSQQHELKSSKYLPCFHSLILFAWKLLIISDSQFSTLSIFFLSISSVQFSTKFSICSLSKFSDYYFFSELLSEQIECQCELIGHSYDYFFYAFFLHALLDFVFEAIDSRLTELFASYNAFTNFLAFVFECYLQFSSKF